MAWEAGRLSTLPIDEGLWRRIRSAGAQVTWRPTGSAMARPKAGKSGDVRRAWLNEQEARIEVRERPKPRVTVDSGPLGALLLLLEIDRRGPPSRLRGRDAGEVPGFDAGAIEAEWGSTAGSGPSLPLADLVGLARYAL